MKVLLIFFSLVQMLIDAVYVALSFPKPLRSTRLFAYIPSFSLTMNLVVEWLQNVKLALDLLEIIWLKEDLIVVSTELGWRVIDALEIFTQESWCVNPVTRESKHWNSDWFCIQPSPIILQTVGTCWSFGSLENYPWSPNYHLLLNWYNRGHFPILQYNMMMQTGQQAIMLQHNMVSVFNHPSKQQSMHHITWDHSKLSNKNGSYQDHQFSHRHSHQQHKHMD